MKQPNDPYRFICDTIAKIREQRAAATEGPRSESPTLGLDEVIAQARERGMSDGCTWTGQINSSEAKARTTR